MFVDFGDVFKKDNYQEHHVPTTYLNYLNKNAPEGFEYIEAKDGFCHLVSKTAGYNISGFSLKLTNNQKKILGDSPSFKDVLAYANNAQEPISIKFDEDETIICNSQKIKVRDFVKRFNNPIQVKSGSWYIMPNSFPEPFPVTIGDDKYEVELLVKRKPNKSVNVLLYESVQSFPLSLFFFVNTKTNKSTLKINIDLSESNSVREIVECCNIYNSFIDGKGIFMGEHFPASVELSNNRCNKKTIRFWEKVLAIESFLNVHFCPSDEMLENDVIYIVESLYQTLIKKTPVRNRKSVESISGTWKQEALKPSWEESLGKEILFEYETKYTVTLFGVSIELFALEMIINAVLADWKEEEKSQTIFFGNKNEEQRKYNSIMYFRTEKELKEFKKTEKKIEQFVHAVNVN